MIFGPTIKEHILQRNDRIRTVIMFWDLLKKLYPIYQSGRIRGMRTMFSAKNENSSFPEHILTHIIIR